MSTPRPLSNNLLIKRADPDTRTQGGLYVPDQAQKTPHRGKVIAAGPGWVSDRGVLIPTTCKEGDEVLYAPNIEGVPVTVGGEVLTFISEDAILAILES